MESLVPIYLGLGGGDALDLEATFTDLVADVCHWGRSLGLDVHAGIERGVNHYLYEVEEGAE